LQGPHATDDRRYPEPGHDDRLGSDTLDLRDYIDVLRRRKLTVLATTLGVVLTAGIVMFLQTPVYQSEARLTVVPSGALSDDTVLRELVVGEREIQTQRELLASVPVASRVIDDLGLASTPQELLGQVDVTAVRDANILEIRASALSPAEASAIAQGFAESYLDFRRQQASGRANEAATELESRIATMRERINELAAERGAAEGGQLAALEEEQEALLTELGQASAQLSGVRATETALATGGEIIAPADVPESPASPRPLRTGALALVLGAMLGVGLAFVRDFLDDAIRSDDEAVRATGRPVLGHVPNWPSIGEHKRAVTLTEPSSPAAESYRTLRTNLRYLAVESPIRTLLVTSGQPGEGKTTTSANLAVAAARSGARVLLIAADLRRPKIHELFGISSVGGLTDVLAEDLPLAEAIRDIGVPNLRVIPSGDIPPNPTELLASARMDAFIAQTRDLADLVIYDGPPVLGVADALEIAPRLDATLLVLGAGSSGRSAVRSTATRLAGVGARVAGSVMNRISEGDSHYGYYYAGYVYGSEATQQLGEPPPRGGGDEAPHSAGVRK
jgi:polysaccharide biosynthesis transport protein